jgi:hypothetical protein
MKIMKSHWRPSKKFKDATISMLNGLVVEITVLFCYHSFVLIKFIFIITKIKKFLKTIFSLSIKMAFRIQYSFQYDAKMEQTRNIDFNTTNFNTVKEY